LTHASLGLDTATVVYFYQTKHPVFSRLPERLRLMAALNEIRGLQMLSSAGSGGIYKYKEELRDET
jgi:hypothetical protein